MAQVDESQLLGEIDKRTKGAYGSSRKKAPTPRGSGLPGGLLGAIAKIVGYKVAKSEQGIPYLSLQCVTASPSEYAGTKFNISYRFQDTERKSAGQVMDELCNDLQLIGGDLANAATLTQMVAVIKTLIKSGNHFKLNTRAWEFTNKGQKMSGVSYLIQGPSDPQDLAQEEVVGGPVEPDAQEEEETPQEEEEFVEDAGETEGDEEPWSPQVDEIYGFKANPRAAASDFKISSVDAKGETVNLVSLDGKKKFSKVPWTKLENASE